MYSNKKQINIFYGLLLLLSTPSVMYAQAWVKSKHEGFFKLDLTTIYARNIYDTKGDVVPFRTLGNYTTAFYGEYGIHKKLTLFAYIPFWVRNTINRTVGRQTGNTIEDGIETNNFGDMDLGFRYPLYNKNISVSLNVFFGLPTGNARQVDGLFTGDGEFNQMAKIAVGKGGRKWWVQGALGFNNRTKNFSDEIRYDAEFGYKLLNNKLLAILKINGIESLQNGNANASATGLFSNNVEFLGIGPEFLYFTASKWGVSLRLAGALKGQNVLAAPSISIGAFHQF